MEKYGHEFGQVMREINIVLHQIEGHYLWVHHDKIPPRLAEELNSLKQEASHVLRQALALSVHTESKTHRWHCWLLQKKLSTDNIIAGILVEVFTVSVAIGAEFVVNSGSWVKMALLVKIVMGTVSLPIAAYLVVGYKLKTSKYNFLMDVFFKSASTAGLKLSFWEKALRILRAGVVGQKTNYPERLLTCNSLLKNDKPKFKK